MSETTKYSPFGESWESYREKHFTPEEIAENNRKCSKEISELSVESSTIVPLNADTKQDA